MRLDNTSMFTVQRYKVLTVYSLRTKFCSTQDYLAQLGSLSSEKSRQPQSNIAWYKIQSDYGHAG